jgi:hypothetical protein
VCAAVLLRAARTFCCNRISCIVYWFTNCGLFKLRAAMSAAENGWCVRIADDRTQVCRDQHSSKIVLGTNATLVKDWRLQHRRTRMLS